jgi:hypothetical protein
VKKGYPQAVAGAIVATLLGHLVWLFLVLKGAACFNTLYPGPSPRWLCHLTRFAFYFVVAAGVVWLWNLLSGAALPFARSTILVAAIVWAYWLILDPVLFFQAVAGTPLEKWWMEQTYGRPILGELYWGYGFARYHVWFACGQGVLTVATLFGLGILRNRAKRGA